MPLLFGDIYFPENFNTEFAPLKEKIETLINLSRTAGNERRYSILNNKLMRICLLVGLSTPGKRDVKFVESMKLQKGSRFQASFFYSPGTCATLFGAHKTALSRYFTRPL